MTFFLHDMSRHLEGFDNQDLISPMNNLWLFILPFKKYELWLCTHIKNKHISHPDAGNSLVQHCYFRFLVANWHKMISYPLNFFGDIGEPDLSNTQKNKTNHQVHFTCCSWYHSNVTNLLTKWLFAYLFHEVLAHF